MAVLGAAHQPGRPNRRLAALRHTDAQLAALRAALDALESDTSGAGDTVSPDFRFIW
jgi:DNA-binding FadR family transcriptional regulator